MTSSIVSISLMLLFLLHFCNNGLFTCIDRSEKCFKRTIPEYDCIKTFLAKNYTEIILSIVLIKLLLTWLMYQTSDIGSHHSVNCPTVTALMCMCIERLRERERQEKELIDSTTVLTVRAQAFELVSVKEKVLKDG